MKNAKCKICNQHFAFFIFHFSFCIYPFFSPAICFTFAAERPKVVVPFDFVSTFDDGRYGRMAGEMIWKKLAREGGFIVPESMLDARDYCDRKGIQPSPETDLEQMRKIVRDDFDAEIGVWGSVERAPGAEAEIYDVTIRCVDFSAGPKPKVLYAAKARTRSVAEIPHVYVRQLLDAMAERKSSDPAAPGADDDKADRPNLLTGDFQRGRGGVPEGWDNRCGQGREPLGRLVRWTTEEANPDNKIVRFTLDRNVAENEGVMYYSDFFPIEEGAQYRFQCRWRSKGPAVKVFVKCYDEIDGRRREVFRSQQNVSQPNEAWTWRTHAEDFTPRHTRYAPRWGRVMLYAYLAPGVVEFDDVALRQVAPPAPDAAPKVLRHSTDTKITIEQMEENERRDREIDARQ